MRWLHLSFFLLLSACRAPSAVVTPDSAQMEQVIRVLDTPIEFEGSRSTNVDSTGLSEIRIGLFGPADETDPVGGPMLRAARLAIEEANRDGGYGGVPFRLVTRWNEDPWRGGSREITKLVYPDSVLVVIGSINGDATHLAEQITHKLWVPLLSPVSADPTLTYINVPWIFRLPPDEEVQAQLLLDEAIKRQVHRSLGLVTSTDHDGRVFAGEMKKRLEAAGLPPAFQMQIDSDDYDLEEVVSRIVPFDPDGLILRLPYQEIRPFLQALGEKDVDVPVYLPWIPGLEPVDLDSWKVYSVWPFEHPESELYRSFESAYYTRFGVWPPASAALTYDAMKMVLEALSKSSPDRIALRQTIWEMSGYQGITGTITWDNGGGNTGNPVLYKSKRVGGQ